MQTYCLDRIDADSFVNNRFHFKLDRPHSNRVSAFKIRHASLHFKNNINQPLSRDSVNALDLCCFFDYTDSSKITMGSGSNSLKAVTVQSQNSGDVLFTSSNGAAGSHELIDFGQGKALKSVMNWHWMGDTTNPNKKPGDSDHNSHMSMLIMRDSGTPSIRFFDDDAFYADLFLLNTGVFRWGVPPSSTTYNIVLAPDVPYLFSITKAGTTFTIRAEQLTSPYTVQTDTLENGPEWGSRNDTMHKITFGDAQYGNMGITYGSWAILQSSDSTQINTLQTYLRGLYTGDANQIVPGPFVSSLKLCSDALTKVLADTIVEKKGRNAGSLELLTHTSKQGDYDCYMNRADSRLYKVSQNKQIHELDIYFTRSNGDTINPQDFSVFLEFY